ncbi:MAG: sulfotransferase domain-containing protein [Hyphomicrobiales bacterium]|nr:sulfotransferase domain-containing protein [Hyphomicrobiales bacterium]
MLAGSLLNTSKNLPIVKELRNNLHKSPVLRWVVQHAVYHNELKLLEGRQKSKSTSPSIVHFTVRKAASQYVKRILYRCAADSGLTPINFDGYSFHSSFPYLGDMAEAEFAQYAYIFQPAGYCYTPFTGLMRRIPNLEQMRKILVVRDPRDVLTSDYFSLARSHVLPGDPEDAERFLRNRTRVNEMSLDEFAMGEKDKLLAFYDDYVKALTDYPGLCVTKYEDLVTNFEHWFNTVETFCQFKVSEKTRRSLIEEAVQPARTENSQNKRRQVTPGDHRQKLQPQTIDTLNQTFAAVLDAFGYDR